MSLHAATIHLASSDRTLAPHLLPLLRVAGTPTKLLPVVEQMITAAGGSSTPQQTMALAMALAATFSDVMTSDYEHGYLAAQDIVIDLMSDDKHATGWDELTYTWYASNQAMDPQEIKEWEGEGNQEYPSAWKRTVTYKLAPEELFTTQPFGTLLHRYKIPVRGPAIKAMVNVLVANSRLLVPFFLGGVKHWLHGSGNAVVPADANDAAKGLDVLVDLSKAKADTTWDYKIGQPRMSRTRWEVPVQVTVTLRLSGDITGEPPESDYDDTDDYDPRGQERRGEQRWASLRSRTIRLAASMPNGSGTRLRLLVALKE